MVLKEHPDLNGIIRWNKIYLRKTVDIFTQVAIGSSSPQQKADLSGAKIESCDEKSLLEIAQSLKGKSSSIREGKDKHFKSTTKTLDIIPSFFLPYMLRFIEFLNYDLNLDLSFLGLPYDPFGSAMVTSVGMLKVPSGYAPLFPLSRGPLIICLGEIVKKPWVVDDAVVARPILDIRATFDHRFMDGLTASRMIKQFKEILENPAESLG